MAIGLLNRCGVDIMHVNRTFSLKYETVRDLNEQVRPKLRSKFVQRAIEERLKPSEIDVAKLSTRHLMALLMSRNVSVFVKKTLALELGIDVEAYL